MAEQHRFGPSGILRSFLGSITASLSSLPSNPFRWNLPSVPLLPSIPPTPPLPSEQNLQNWSHPSPLFPHLELEESRKRSRLGPDILASDPNKKQQKQSSSPNTTPVVNSVDPPLQDAFMAPAEFSPCPSSDTPNSSSGIHQTPDENSAPTLPVLTPKVENSDETLVGYMERVSKAKKKVGKRGQGTQDIMRNKRMKVSKSDTALSGQKRKEPDDSFVSVKYEKKLRLLSISEEIQQKEDDEGDEMQDHEASLATAAGTSNADNKLRRSVSIHNLPVTAKRIDVSKLFSRYGAIESVNMEEETVSYKSILRRRNVIKDEIEKSKTSHSASIVYKDEASASAALSLNVKEFNGSYIFVTAACSSTLVSEDLSGLPYNLTHAAIISNLPFDIKDEDLLQILHGYSTSIRIQAFRIFRSVHPHLGATAHVVFKSLSNVHTVQLKSKDKPIQVSRVSTSSKRNQKEPAKEPVAHTRKRLRDPKANTSSIQKRRTTVRHSGTKEYQLSINKNDKESDLAKNASPESLSGMKQKREEKHQRGVSRSKKIRRS